jgi:hypothetical protein
METIALWISALTLLLGTLLGLKGWFDPRWGADLVRLAPKEGQPEGVAEFRATFGGMFAGLHAMALVLLMLDAGQGAAGSGAGGAVCLVLAAGWLGTAIARTHAYLADPPARHPFVRFSIGLEIVVGLLTAALPLARLAAGIPA